MLTFKITGKPLNEEDQLFFFLKRLLSEVDSTKKATHTVAFEVPGGFTVKLRVRLVETVQKTGAPRKGRG